MIPDSLVVDKKDVFVVTHTAKVGRGSARCLLHAGTWPIEQCDSSVIKGEGMVAQVQAKKVLLISGKCHPCVHFVVQGTSLVHAWVSRAGAHRGEEGFSLPHAAPWRIPHWFVTSVLSLPDSCPYIRMAVPLLPLLLWPDPQPAPCQLTFFQMWSNFYLLSFNTQAHCIFTNTVAPGLRSVVFKLL